MNRIFTIFCLVLLTRLCPAQSIGIGTTTPNSSAQLDITGTSRGLLIPRMTTAGINSIPSPAKGLMVYDTTQNFLMVNMGAPSSPNWVNIVAGSGWSLKGNSSNLDSIFIGTIDGNYLQMRVANQLSGWIDTVYFNTGLGYRALEENFETPTRVTGSIGTMNTAVGFQSLRNNTGAVNTAFGVYALYDNTTGGNNTALGSYSLWFNTTGSNNTATGWSALGSNQTGVCNVADGVGALGGNTSGFYNTAVGYNALGPTSASYYNVAVGYNAASTWNDGYNNVFLGANTDVNGDGYYNVIAIGQDVICTGSSQARIGNAATGSIGGYANWTNFSDGRYKRNIRENVKGLDFILKLRPITYNLDVTGIRGHLGQTAPKDAGTQQSIRNRETTVFSGFSAQEVEQAAAAAGYDFSGVDKPQNANDFYGLRYSDFVVPLVKAIQEQQQMIRELQQQVADLKKQLKP